MKVNLIRWALLLALPAVTACEEDNEDMDRTEVLAAFNSASSDPQDLTFYALKGGNTLDRYSIRTLNAAAASTPLTGLNGAMLVAIDFRPRNGGLYAMGSDNRLYQINPSTGAATQLPALFTTATNTPPVDATTPRNPVMVNGSVFAFDFNPAADRLRVITGSGQSLRINVETGFTIMDGSINPQPATVSAAAYDGNDNDAATPTELYVLDNNTDRLLEVDPPNNGTLVSIGASGLALDGETAFDIAPRSAAVTTDIGLGFFRDGMRTVLFRINVDTGVATPLVRYSPDLNYTGIAIAP